MIQPDTLAGFACLLRQLSLGKYAPGIYPIDYEDGFPLPRPLPCVVGGRLDGWRGHLQIAIRLKNLRMSPERIRKLVPLLAERRDLLDLLVIAILRARQNWFEHFIAQLEPSVYRTVASASHVPPSWVTICKSSEGDCGWLILFYFHCADVAAMCSEALEELAQEGEKK